MEIDTFYSLVASFLFINKIVVIRKTSDACMGESVPYNINRH